DICRVPAAGGKVECLTKDNAAADGGPQFSPDGKHLAYRSQKRPGFEADRWELMLVETTSGGACKGKPRSITPNFDGWVDSFVWSGDGVHIYFVAEEKAAAPIFSVSLPEGKITTLLEGSTTGSLSISRDGKTLAFTRTSLYQPAEIYVCHPESHKLAEVNVSQANTAILDELSWGKLETSR